jgi:uroporphyrinogen-III synthase|tara:strand:+ start:45 stop:743 length:699 start_codon:yes stop_codon:yes gene_type:complete
MHILFTRSLEDSKDLILRFNELGHKVSYMPVIQIKKVDHDVINFNDFKGLIFTSANSLKFINSKEVDKNIFCFCVGSATEKKALSLGFQNVISAEGNVRNLKEIILRNFNSNVGKILYLSGELISKDLDKELNLLGYDIKRIINYTANPIREIDQKFLENLKSSVPDILYVYSQNSALSLLNLINKYNLNDIWMNTNLMCMSEKISSVLNNIKWKKIFLFNAGEEEYLLYKI